MFDVFHRLNHSEFMDFWRDTQNSIGENLIEDQKYRN